MAKIKFGMMMTDARGKLGGQVFSKNRSGAYVRTKVTPVNPRTASQQANRALLGNLSSQWSALTDTQRSAWNSAVESWQKTNVFGDLQKPTGKNLFTGLNKNVLNLFEDSTVMLLPPAKAEMVTLRIVNSTFSVSTTGQFLVAFEGTEITGKTVRVRATPPLSAGTTYVKNKLRDLGTSYAIDAEGGILINSAYVAKFGTAPASANIWIEVAEVQENGQIGVPVLYKVDVV